MSEEAPDNMEELNAAVQAGYAELFDMNAHIFNATRKQVMDLEVIREAFLLQADRVSDIIELYILGAKMVAESTADLILVEYAVEEEKEDGENGSDQEDAE